MSDLKPRPDLVSFARQYGPHDYNYEQAELEPLCGDAGFRKYFRYTSTPSLIIADSPPEVERNFDTVRVNHLLQKAGVRAAEIYAVDFESGTFVIEDLGAEPLQDAALAGYAKDVYRKAVDFLWLLQTHIKKPEWLEDYSGELLQEEMDLFSEWFLKELLGIAPDAEQAQMLKRFFERLIDSAIEQPQVFVHRDFHCRNLMMAKNSDSVEELKQSENGEIATIDYQDALWGPVTYDLVSLARDCYLRWEPSEVDSLVGFYSSKLDQLTEAQRIKFPKWFDLMGLQRHIKVLGIFARLALRDNKESYLTDLPLVLRYTIEALAKYPEFKDLHQWFLNDIIPLASKQPWYSDWQAAGQGLNQSLVFD